MSSKAKSFRKVLGGTEENRRLQSNVENAISKLIRHPLMDYRLERSVALASGANVIEHKLGRTPIGYLVVSQSNASTIYDSSMDDKFLNLVTSGAVTVSLLIF
jgi:hypothetical protein